MPQPVVVVMKDELEDGEDLTVQALMALLSDCDPEAVVWIRKQSSQETSPLIALEDNFTEVRLVV